jgi:hypothetical protein
VATTQLFWQKRFAGSTTLVLEENKRACDPPAD